MTSTAWQCCSEMALHSKQSTLIDQNAKTCCRMIVHLAPPNAAEPVETMQQYMLQISCLDVSPHLLCLLLASSFLALLGTCMCSHSWLSHLLLWSSLLRRSFLSFSLCCSCLTLHAGSVLATLLYPCLKSCYAMGPMPRRGSRLHRPAAVGHASLPPFASAAKAVIVMIWVLCVFAHVCDPPKHQAHGKLLLVLSEIVVAAMQTKLMLTSSSNHKHNLTCVECHMELSQLCQHGATFMPGALWCLMTKPFSATTWRCHQNKQT